MKELTILDVVDNFFGDDLPDFRTLSKSRVYEFGEEVRRFAGAYIPPAVKSENPTATYLGGWPSARWDFHTPMLMTSLLYAGQVLGNDLISDWFSDEQYKLPLFFNSDAQIFHRTANGLARAIPVILREQRGYKPPVGWTEDEALDETRAFLHKLIPTLRQARPLLESGILVLAPSRQFEYNNAKHAETLATTLLPTTIPDVKAFTQRFSPADIPVSNEKRGLFGIIESSNLSLVEQQIRNEVREALYYFATEYLFAKQNGFIYTAPFEFEAHVCKESLVPTLSRGNEQHIQECLLNSRLPLFQGLTPETLAKICNDDGFVKFRGELYGIYASVPKGVRGPELERHIREAEAANLQPILAQIEQNQKRGVLSRLGFSKISVIRMAVTLGVSHHLTGNVAVDVASGVVGELIQTFFGRDREKGTSVIWQRLHKHGRSVKSEFHGLETEGRESKKPYWGTPLTNGLIVNATSGAYVPYYHSQRKRSMKMFDLANLGNRPEPSDT